jgi:hypothetical protein
MNYAELIAEAQKARDCHLQGMHDPDISALIGRLAAAVRELAPPEGWSITRYDNAELGAIELDNGEWHTGRYEDGQVFITWHTVTHPTAADAMAALDGESK